MTGVPSAFVITATRIDESTPPLRKAPNGTSLTSCSRADCSSALATASTCSSYGAARSPACRSMPNDQYRSVRDRATLDDEPMSRQQRLDVAQYRARLKHRAVRQQRPQRGRVDARGYEPAREQCLELRREDQSAAYFGVQQRLDAKVVASEHQPLAAAARRRASQMASANIPRSLTTKSSP